MGSVPREINATQVGTRRAFPTPSIGLLLGLQVLDVLTTMIGLRLGGPEGSTFIGHLRPGGTNWCFPGLTWGGGDGTWQLLRKGRAGVRFLVSHPFRKTKRKGWGTGLYCWIMRATRWLGWCGKFSARRNFRGCGLARLSRWIGMRS